MLLLGLKASSYLKGSLVVILPSLRTTLLRVSSLALLRLINS